MNLDIKEIAPGGYQLPLVEMRNSAFIFTIRSREVAEPPCRGVAVRCRFRRELSDRALEQ